MKNWNFSFQNPNGNFWDCLTNTKLVFLILMHLFKLNTDGIKNVNFLECLKKVFFSHRIWHMCREGENWDMVEKIPNPWIASKFKTEHLENLTIISSCDLTFKYIWFANKLSRVVIKHITRCISATQQKERQDLHRWK